MIDALRPLWTSFAEFAPRLFGAGLVLLGVLLAAYLLKRLTVRFLRRVNFDALFERTDTVSSLQRIGINVAPSRIIGQLVFWGILLAGVASALSILGLATLQGNIDLLVSLVGRGLIAVVILAIGLVVAGWLANLTVRQSEQAGIAGGEVFRQVVFALVLAVAGLLAAAQIGLNVTLLVMISLVVLGTLGLVAALALGLGLAPLSTNIAAARYAQANLRPGDRVSVNGLEGTVEDLNYAAVTLRSDEGDLHYIPNRTFLEASISKRPGREDPFPEREEDAQGDLD
ncbi:Mechanosensitive ion channel [Rubrobacter radiotolerans]|uniref:Mechanosensitive ion channel n=1 Tax=Rubrobacter radiotolerans TaxID=42256 RepID=A0A023X671_RUBRA|nr:mechanosensitive ion channel domain-containing protein [Rubrobacter radiotolerans]AHY47495.1 Mechanosensitive ion channel [Rubrobacter radiotolerans]MDX5894898.1 mechanosensitive ion channel [Rubrobacter radiotolerans]SMC07021.1 Conserved TM helix [Rubrobacter radiotolerans DSM 5868]